jgi:RND family efflux transporter MFP subunit
MGKAVRQQEATMKLWKLITVIGVLVLGAGGTFAALSLRPEASAAQSRGLEARLGELVETASASGTIEPDVQVAVKSRASGEVIEVLAEEGDTVQAGDLLVRLDPRDAEQDVREAQMALSRAQDSLTQARAELSVSEAQAAEAEAQAAVRSRGAELGLVSAEESRSSSSSAATSRTSVSLRQAQLRSARTNVESARLVVEEAERRLSEMVIRAPVSGTVLSVDVEVGSIVASGITSVSGGSSVVTIADLSDLRVVGQIDEAQVGQVAAGQDVTVRVDAFSDRTFTGRVERVSPLGETSSNVVTFDVEIAVTDKDASLLRSGMSADLEIVTARHENVVLVPITAVQGQGSRQFVTMASGERRPVRTGGTDGSSMVVLEGLQAGEQIASASGTASRSSSRSESSERRSSGMLPMGGGPGGPRPG